MWLSQIALSPICAYAQPTADTTTPGAAGETPSPADPTGGAYTTPTLLFIPAGAVPKWNVRAIASTELQSPSDVNAGVRPGLGVELGIPAGFTLGAGTNWVGGDVNATGKTDFNLGISPYFQGRYHILGNANGRGWQLGTSLTYKFVGFEGDPGELEMAASFQIAGFSTSSACRPSLAKISRTRETAARNSTPMRLLVRSPSSRLARRTGARLAC